MMNLNAEMIEKAKAAASVEELMEIAKANAVELTPAEAATYFAQLNPVTGELSDDDLDAVSGGACAGGDNQPIKDGDAVRVINGKTCPNCGGTVGVFIRGGEETYVMCTGCNKGLKGYTIDMYPEPGIDMELI